MASYIRHGAVHVAVVLFHGRRRQGADGSCSECAWRTDTAASGFWRTYHCRVAVSRGCTQSAGKMDCTASFHCVERIAGQRGAGSTGDHAALMETNATAGRHRVDRHARFDWSLDGRLVSGERRTAGASDSGRPATRRSTMMFGFPVDAVSWCGRHVPVSNRKCSSRWSLAVAVDCHGTVPRLFYRLVMGIIDFDSESLRTGSVRLWNGGCNASRKISES